DSAWSGSGLAAAGWGLRRPLWQPCEHLPTKASVDAECRTAYSSVSRCRTRACRGSSMSPTLSLKRLWRRPPEATAVAASAAAISCGCWPVEATCASGLQDIGEAFESLWTAFVAADRVTAAKPTFTVHFKARNFDKLERQDVINRVFTAVKSVSPTGQLTTTAASVVIDVNVLQRVTCLSLLRNFRRYRKYNLSEVVAHSAARRLGRLMRQSLGRLMRRRLGRLMRRRLARLMRRRLGRLMRRRLARLMRREAGKTDAAEAGKTDRGGLPEGRQPELLQSDLAQQLSQANRSFDSNLQIPIARSRLATQLQNSTELCASSWLAAFLFNSGVCCRLLLVSPRRPRRRSARGWKMRSTGSTGTPVLVDRLQSGGDTEPISIRQASNSENQCDYDYLEANETVASCGDLSFTLAGFTISGDSVPVSPACANPRASIGDQRSACIRKYILDLATGKPTPQCKFSKRPPARLLPGYGGENCQQVVCFPKDGGCQNGGRCVKPDKCECQSGFQGAMCDEDLAELQKDTASFATAFPSASCSEERKFGRKTTPFSDCCSAGGNSFGYSGVLHACTSSTGTSALPPATPRSSRSTPARASGPNSISTFERAYAYEFEGRLLYLAGREHQPQPAVVCQGRHGELRHLQVLPENPPVPPGRSATSSWVGRQSLQVYQISGLDGAQMLKGLQRVRFIRRGDSIIMTSRSLGLRLRWDSIGSVQLTLDRPGLCGNYDGDKKNEFGEFGQPVRFRQCWKAQDCPDSANVPVHCRTRRQRPAPRMECRQIDSIFFPCHDRIPAGRSSSSAASRTLAWPSAGASPPARWSAATCVAYAGLCSLGGICIDWRSSNLCPTNCSEPNMYWKECASECPTTCANYDQVKSELCECEPDYVHHKGKCVRKTDCPAGTTARSSRPAELHTAVRELPVYPGSLELLQRASCPKTCLVTAFECFRTFDGAQLDFNGRTCERVRTENVLITDPNQLANLPKRVHSHYAAYRIELVATSLNYGSRASVFINDEDVTNSLPFSNQDDHLLPHHRLFRRLRRNIEIKANERVRSNVKGLCGNYDGDTENDLHPRNSTSGRVLHQPESAPTRRFLCVRPAFADQVSGSDHCQLALLTGDSFKACRESNKVDLNGHYLRSCRREVASGGVQGQQFLFCSSLVQAAIECKNQGYDVDFYRDSVLSLCVGGGTFSLCSRTCRSTCSDLESTEICEEGCFPGCDCQYDSQYRDHHGTCVRKSECTCRDRFNPDSAIYKAGDLHTNCTCSNGAFVCEDEACEDKVVCPKNQVFMDLRCEDYNNCPRSAMLQKRCGCPGGQVKKSDGTCVPANQCPCKLLKKEYPPMHKLKMACKRFVCKDQTWKQIGKDRKCEAVCKAQGDPHYFTFDKKKFNFQGKCQYTLVSFDGDASRGLPKFHISAQNVPCGSKQVTCTKFVRIIIGDERYTLVRGQEKDEFPAPFASYG
uniref:EGF-like domain-containing protein n=1 Tax=Macrostomum lignano TaxID=282301 RepID=A0A1I8FSB1_9PLAT